MAERESCLAKGVFAGLIGGLIGTIVMTQFQSAWGKASKALENGADQGATKAGELEKQEEEDATMKAAAKISEFAGRPLSHEQKKALGPVVHYSFGTLQGAIYGGVTEMAGTRGGLLPGMIFGGALFVAADEIAAPALGFSQKPAESPVSSHLYGLAAHLVYGITAEIARRGLRLAL